MKKTRFTLHADTFLWLKGSVGLVYNTKNKRQFLFSLSDRIEKKCQQLLKTDNLYTIELTDEDINSEDINQWICSLIDISAGYLSHNIAYEKRPVSLKPILKVQDKREHYEWQHTNGKGGEVLQNLHELTFYINGSEYGNNEYYKQHVFPLNDYKVLDSSKIQSFIINSRNPFLSNINIAGNIFSFPDFEKLLANISSLSIQSTIYVMIQDFLDNMPKVKEINWPNDTQFILLVDSVFDISLLQNIPMRFSVTAFVFSEKDYIQFSNLFKLFSMDQNTQMIPLYNRENLSFLETNVFIEKDELDHIDLSKKDIFIRQSLNIGNFGELTIMPDSYVYDNVNEPPLGTINDSPLFYCIQGIY